MSTKNIILIVIAFLFVSLIVWIGGTQKATAPITETNLIKSTMTATITTSKGVITLELYGDQAPNTVANFKKLADSGFYNGTRFHRVIKGFMIQGGDPLSKDPSKIQMWGTGGPGYKFADEIIPSSELYKVGYQRGILAMANSGPNTNGSQFFIMHEDVSLQPAYTIFGKVTSGLDVVDAIANVKTVDPANQNDRPVEDVIIEKVDVR